MMPKSVSRYSIIYTLRNSCSFDCTAIGVVVFDAEGKQVGHQISNLTRAKRRGDYPTNDDGSWLAGWIESLNSLDRLQRHHESIGAAMSFVKVSDVSGSLLPPDQLLAHIYKQYVVEE